MKRKKSILYQFNNVREGITSKSCTWICATVGFYCGLILLLVVAVNDGISTEQSTTAEQSIIDSNDGFHDKVNSENGLFRRLDRAITSPLHNDAFPEINRQSLTARIKESDNVKRDDATNKEGYPYLDEEGNICEDKMEVMQHVEYDTQIHCKVKIKEHCDVDVPNTFEGLNKTQTTDADETAKNPNEKYGDKVIQVCHTMTRKECETTYRPQMTKVKVRVCPNGIDLDKESKQKMENSVVIDVRPSPMPKFVRQRNCVNGKRTMCVTKYETMCVNKEVTHEMLEDYPRCRVEMMNKCKNNTQGEHVFLRALKRDQVCQKVPAMRCRIEKRKVIKTKPETSCKRMPRQFCRKEDCENTHKTSTVNILDEELCYYRIQMVNEIIPQKKCRYVPKRICHTRNTNPLSKDEIISAIEPLGTAKSKEMSEKDGSNGTRKSRINTYQEGNSQLPDHLSNFREFHSLPAPISSKLIVLNRRIKRSTSHNCIMIPEERCKNVRVNPKPVFKKMKRKICRKPRTDVSSHDRHLVTRLQMWAKSINEEGNTHIHEIENKNNISSKSTFKTKDSINENGDHFP